MIETYLPRDDGSHPNCVTAKVEQEVPAPFHEARNPSQRFFSLDHSATSKLANDLASCGHDVHVITSQQLYDDPQAGLPSQEALGGVGVHRVTNTHFGRSKLIGRVVDYLSFYAAAWRTLLEVTRPGDVLVAMTDPPLISLVAL
jgi:colanic acid biosynthesis glycosyl transferase WcaI